MKQSLNTRKRGIFCISLALFYALAFSFFAVPVYAVSEAALLFLLISPSPQANASGEKVKYIDAAQADPLPRTAYVGINLGSGLSYLGDSICFDIFSFKWAREAEDLLVRRYRDGTSDYLFGLGEINFGSNILFGKSNDEIITKKGWEFGISDFLFIRRGNYEDIEGKVVFKTKGWSINFMQPFKIISALDLLDTSDIFIKLLLNLDIEYHESEWKVAKGHPLAGTNFKGLIFKLNNFHWIFNLIKR